MAYPHDQFREDTFHVLLMHPGFLAGLVKMPELDLADAIIPLVPNDITSFAF